MKRQPAPRRLSHDAASRALQGIEDAQEDIDGTVAVFSALIDHCSEAEGHSVTIERFLKTDLTGLKAAIEKASEAILPPLEAEQAKGGTESGGGRATVCSLVVDNAGDAS